MAKVCVVIEHWYSDCGCKSDVLAVAGNPSTAENIVAGRKKELIDKALEFDSKCSVNGSTWHSEKIYDALRLDFSKTETPFDEEYCLFGRIAFDWEIEDHEIE